MASLHYNSEGDEKTFELTGAVCTFGRSSDNSCILKDRELSRQHFQVERTEFGFKVVDRESRNGTRVNDDFVNQHLLRPGDRIQIGKLVLVFKDPDFVEPRTKGVSNSAPPHLPPPSGKEPESKLMTPQFSSTKSTRPAKPSPSRARSGGTTAIYRVRPSQRGSVREDGARSKSVLTGVFAVAGLFLVLIVIILIIGSVTKDKKNENEKEAPAWEDSSEDPDPNELAHLADIRERIKNRDYSGANQLVDEFLTKYPDSENLKAVRKYRREFEEKLNSESGRKYNNLITSLDNLQRRNRFGEAIRELAAQINDPDLALYQTRLSQKKNDLILAGKKYYKARIAEGEAMIEGGDVSAARKHFGRLKRSLEKEDEFQLLLEATQSHLDSLGNP